MPYEVTCPSCRVRLHIKDDSSQPWLICPRCLSHLPHPAGLAPAIAVWPAPPPPPPPRQKSFVPSIESEVKSSSWIAYFIVLGLTLMGIVGAVLAAGQPTDGPKLMLVQLMLGLVFVLTLLILYPIGRALFFATAPRAGAASRNTALRTLGIFVRTLGIIGLLAVLAPVAFVILFLTVCAAVGVVERH